MGILEQCGRDSDAILNKSKIPEYARDFEKEWLFIRGINNLTLARNLKIYIEEGIMRSKMQNKSHKENWGKIIIYEMILNLLNFIIEYFNNPTKIGLR